MLAFRISRPLIVGFALLLAGLVSASPALAVGSDWRVGYYTPSGRALSNASADATPDGVAAFNFTDQPNTALLVTDHGAFNGTLLGDLTGKTITATVRPPYPYGGEFISQFIFALQLCWFPMLISCRFFF